jgi:hypothetical protein
VKRSKEETAALNLSTGWTARQRNHLRRLVSGGATIAYCLTDSHGRPANHEMDQNQRQFWTVRPGLVQVVRGPLEICTERALHGTKQPHRWRGSRVWVAGFVGAVQRNAHEHKLAGLRREIVGEVFPEHAFDSSVGARLGRKDLSRANLTGAYLTGADLTGADLTGADLSWADLTGADLTGADLTGADLSRANLTGADLSRADLTGADLTGARYPNANAKAVATLVDAGYENDTNGCLVKVNK